MSRAQTLALRVSVMILLAAVFETSLHVRVPMDLIRVEHKTIYHVFHDFEPTERMDPPR